MTNPTNLTTSPRPFATLTDTQLRGLSMALEARIAMLRIRATANDEAGNPRRAERARIQIAEVSEMVVSVANEQEARFEVKS
jgi:hypothetical protein